MVANKEIRAEPYEYGMQLFSLPHNFRLAKNAIDHQRLEADLYVAYHLAGVRFWQIPDSTDAEYEMIGLIPDRSFIYDTKVIFLEVDRGGEDYNTAKGIRGKLDKYVQLAKIHPKQRIHVCFTTVDELYPTRKLKRTAQARAKGILRVMEDYRRGDMFMVTLHKYAVAMPEEAIWCSGINPTGVSLLMAT